jgi:hypothetical protein
MSRCVSIELTTNTQVLIYFADVCADIYGFSKISIQEYVQIIN